MNIFDFHDTMSMIHEYTMFMYIKFTLTNQCNVFLMQCHTNHQYWPTARNISKHEYKMYHSKRIPTMDGVQAPFLSVNSSAQNIHHKEV